MKLKSLEKEKSKRKFNVKSTKFENSFNRKFYTNK